MILVRATNTMSTLLNRKIVLGFVLCLASLYVHADTFITMSVNETRHMSLSYVPKDIVVGSDKIVDVTLTDSNNLYLIAHEAGKTKVIVKGEEETTEYVIQVRDTDQETENLNKYLDSAGFKDIEAVKVAEKIYINGAVKDKVEKRELNELIRSAISSYYVDNTTITETAKCELNSPWPRYRRALMMILASNGVLAGAK